MCNPSRGKINRPHILYSLVNVDSTLSQRDKTLVNSYSCAHATEIIHVNLEHDDDHDFGLIPYSQNHGSWKVLVRSSQRLVPPLTSET
jgi:hypothetical protein